MPSSISQSRTRLDWIDRTKGLAILGIVLFHFFQNYPDRTFLVSLFDRSGAKLGLAAVDLFFVVAGFNISYGIAKNDRFYRKLKDWKSWLIKRLDRLYPTYLLAVFCSILLYEIAGRSVRYFSFEFIMSVLGFGGYLLQAINPGFWFFTVILQAYLLSPFIYILLKCDRRGFLIFGIIAGVLTKILCLNLEPSSSAYLYFLNNNFLGSYIFQFCLGLYWGEIYLFRGALRKVDFIASIILFILGAIVYAGLTIAKIDIVYMQGFDMIFTPILFILCLWGFDNLAKHVKPIAPFLKSLSILGTYSYPIYLIHQPMLFVTLPNLVKFFHTNSELKVMISLFVAALLLIGYTLGFIELEKLLRKQYS
jgi:peptidoglycan/LPS O-acetylase OafA/YrhL